MPYDDLRPGLKPPQFRLRTLMLLTTAMSLLCATFVVGGPLSAFALLMALLLILAHVAGNAIGTQLRENGDVGMPSGKRSPPRTLPSIHFAPATHLSQHYALGLPNLISVVAGALLGALLGGLALAWINWAHQTPAKLAFGAAAFAALGGMAGFTGGGFVQVAWKTWRSASRAHTADQE